MTVGPVTTGDVLRALSDVTDPELDEPITDLGFVRSVVLDDEGVTVHLRLPTAFCSPNFAYLMASDAQDVLEAVEGIGQVRVLLDDHHDSHKINTGLAANAGYRGTFGVEAVDSLEDLRHTFLRKAHLAALERCVEALLRTTELTLDDLPSLTLSDIPPGRYRSALIRRRLALGLTLCCGTGLRRRRRQSDSGREDSDATAVREVRAHLHGGQLPLLPGTARHPLRRRRRDRRPADRRRQIHLVRSSQEGVMKAVQVVGYHTKLQLTEVPEPKIEGPLDVIVRIGGAGVCRTDIHILEGQWAEKSGVELPYTIGHENAGWVHAVGNAVTNVAVGDKVILHPLITCGQCRACRSGDDVHCENNAFPGIDTHGGYAEYLKTTSRSVVRIDDSLEPADVAALADAGLTAYHAVAKQPSFFTRATPA